MRRTQKALVLLMVFLAWTVAASFSLADDAGFEPEWESVASDNGGIVEIDPEDDIDFSAADEDGDVVAVEADEDEIACLPVDESGETGELELTPVDALGEAQGVGENGDILIQSVEATAYPTVGISDDEAISGYINQRLYASQARVSSQARKSIAVAGSKLGDNTTEANLYSALKPLITQVARGEASLTEFSVRTASVFAENVGYTAEELGVASILEDDAISEAAQLAFLSKTIGERLSIVLNALMVDMPYELYWYDKTYGTSYSLPMSYESSTQRLKLGSFEEGSLVFKFSVAAEYSFTGERRTYLTDQDKCKSIETAAANAKAIVEKYSGLGDIEKLSAYRDEICELVSYNDVAANNGVAYGNPWQLVWVFDGDSTTNVVCEGYAKAFQYLCELSSFKGKITVVTAIGVMSGGTGAGGHMWNNVAIGSGTNRAIYLVDVTNCDKGTVGYPDKLFLKGYSDKDDSSYYFDVGGTVICYTYDDKYVRLFSAEDLELSGNTAGPEETTEYAGTYGALEWALDDDGVLSISGAGEIPAAVGDSVAPWLADVLRESVVSVQLGEGITGLGDGVFSGLSGLTQITLAANTTQFGENVFDGCDLYAETSGGIVIPSCENTAAVAYAKKLYDAKIARYHVTHANIVTVDAVAATCTESGLTEGTKCATCGEILAAQETVPATGHVPETMAAVAPTYTSEGLTEGSRCAVCGIVLVPQEPIDKLVETETEETDPTDPDPTDPDPTEPEEIDPEETDPTESEDPTTAAPVVTPAPRLVATAIPTLASTPTPAPVATSTPAPVATSTPKPAATATPTPKPTATPAPAITEAPSATETPTPTAAAPDYTVHVTRNTSKQVDKGTPIQIVTDGLRVKSYKSSNKKVATVSKTGWVTTKKAGTAKITITLKNKKKLTLKVKVVDPYTPRSVKLLQGKSATLRVGQTLSLSTSLSPATARSALKWKSSNKKVATVNSQGVVTAKKAGKAKITVTTSNKKTATITIKVTK